MRVPGLGDRIKERLVAIGYRQGDKPDLAGFIKAHGYDPRNFYAWANANRVPKYDTFLDLCARLRVAPGWLLFGELAATILDAPRRDVPSLHTTPDPDDVERRGQRRDTQQAG